MSKSRKILVIYDDDDKRNDLCQKIFDQYQYSIIQAKDGLQGYHKTCNEKFDLVVADLNVKKIRGKKLVDDIKSTPDNGQVPMIIYSEDIDEFKALIHDQKLMEFMNFETSDDKLMAKVKELAESDPKKKKFKLDVDFVNPFIDSSMSTLNELCSVENISADKPRLLTEEEELGVDVSGTIAVSSPYFSGSIALSFNEEVYQGIVAQMLEENVANIDFESDDAAAEILNVIYGKSKAVLNNRGYSLKRAIPSVMKGKNHRIYQKTTIPTLIVPFNSQSGEFYIQICVKAI